MTATSTAPPRPETFRAIPLQLLHESSTNPRRAFDAKAMAELVDSVRAHGVLQPILVRATNDDDHDEKFEVVAGARRFRAAKAAGLLEVPAIVRELSDRAVLEIQFVENLQRSDLHPLDEGHGYQVLHEQHGYSVEDLAAKLGKSKAYVYSRMQLAKLPVKAQTLFLEGKIELSHAQLVARIPVPELADKAAADIAKGDGSEKPMGFRWAADFVRRTYQCALKGAPFPQGDKALLPEAGACGPCPKRTGNQRGLFDDGAGASSADVCTDPKCFAAKTRAFFQVRKEEVLAAGGEVLEGKAAEKVLYSYSSNEFVDLKSTCHQDPKLRTYGRIMGKEPVQRVLVQGRDGEAVERVRRADLNAVLKKAGIGRPEAGTRSVSAEERLRAQKHKARKRAFAAVLPALVTAAEKLDPATAWSLVIAHGLSRWTVGTMAAGKRRDLDLRHEAEKLLELHPSVLQGLALEVIASSDPSAMFRSGGWSPEVMAIARACGIDLAAAAKAEERQAKQKPAKKATPAKAAKEPKGKGRKARAAEPPEDADEGEDATDGRCRGCGCTESKACVVDGEPCHWVEPDLCSACSGMQPKKRDGKKTQTKAAKAARAAEP